MSTRCNILVKFNERHNEFRQYYHHTDGYPECMGYILDAFITSVNANSESTNFKDELFKMFLGLGRFEDEGYDSNLHSDIEYVWYVDLTTSKLTYTYIRKDIDFKALRDANDFFMS